MAIANPTDPAVTARLDSYLRPGEKLLWSGRPDPSVVFAPTDIIAVPFGVIWLGISLAWEAGVGAVAAPTVFKLVGVPFVLVGVYLIVGRFFVRVVRKRRTVLRDHHRARDRRDGLILP
jgi:hypothetical protein